MPGRPLRRAREIAAEIAAGKRAPAEVWKVLDAAHDAVRSARKAGAKGVRWSNRPTLTPRARDLTRAVNEAVAREAKRLSEELGRRVIPTHVVRTVLLAWAKQEGLLV